MASIAPESTRKTKVPDPEPQDSTEVTSCLETARELWQNGQLKEAVRWVQRGADAAEQDGNDMRALSLARTAADLAAHAASVQASANNGSATATPNPVANGAGSAANGAPAVAATANDGGSAPKVKQPPALPKVPTVNSQPSAGGAAAPGEPAASRDSLSPNPPVVREATLGVKAGSNSETRSSASKSSPRASTGSLRPSPQAGRGPAASERQTVRLPTSRGGATGASVPPPASFPPTSSATAPASVRPAAVPAPESPAPLKGEVFATPEALAQWLESGKATQVTVKRSALEPSLYVVRPLSEPGKVARGARRAVLIYLDENEPAK